MLKSKGYIGGDSNSEVLLVSQLVDLYDETIEELQECAKFNPCSVSNCEDAEAQEVRFLEQEAALVDQAARVQLHTKDDMQDLMDIWTKVSGIQTGEDIRPSDRIAMNIFRHFSDHKFTKE